MTSTIPPGGSKRKIATACVQQFAPESYPLVIIWIIETKSGATSRSVNIVENQPAFDELNRILHNEQVLLGSKVSCHVLPAVTRLHNPVAQRCCQTKEHNPPNSKQGLYCHTCGQRTYIAKILDGE